MFYGLLLPLLMCNVSFNCIQSNLSVSDECPIPPLNHADIMRREDRKEAVLYCRDGYVLKSLAEPFGRSFEVYCYKDVWYLTPGVPVRDCVKRTACEFTCNVIEY